VWQCGNFIVVDETAFALDFEVFGADTTFDFLRKRYPATRGAGWSTSPWAVALAVG